MRSVVAGVVALVAACGPSREAPVPTAHRAIATPSAVAASTEPDATPAPKDEPPPGLPDAVVAQLGSPLLRHERQFSAIAWSPDGSRIATAADNDLRIWNLANESLEHKLADGHDPDRLIWADDGRLLVSLSDNRQTIRVWEAATGTLVHRVDRKWQAGDDYQSVGAARRAPRIAYDDAGQVTLFDVARMESVGSSRFGKATEDAFVGLALSADGAMLAVARTRDRLAVRDTKSGAERWSAASHGDSIAFDPSGKLFAEGSTARPLRLFDAGSGKLLRELGRHGLDSSAFDIGEGLVAIGGNTGAVTIFDGKSGAMKREIVVDHDRVQGVALSPDRKTVAAVEHGMVRRFKVASGEEVPFEGHASVVRALDISPDGKWLASGGDDGRVVLWDIATSRGKLLREARGTRVWSVRFSHDGKSIGIGGGGVGGELGKGVEVWTLTPLKRVMADRKAIASVRSVAFTANDRELVAAGAHGEVAGFDVATETVRWSRSEPRADGTLAALSPDGTRLFATGETDKKGAASKGYSMLIEPRTGTVAWSRDVAAHEVAFDPQGQRLVMSKGATCEVLDLETNKISPRVVGDHSSLARAVALAGDRCVLGAQRLFDLPMDGKARRVSARVAPAMESLVVHADGKRAFAGADNGVVLVWDLERVPAGVEGGSAPR